MRPIPPGPVPSKPKAPAIQTWPANNPKWRIVSKPSKPRVHEHHWPKWKAFYSVGTIVECRCHEFRILKLTLSGTKVWVPIDKGDVNANRCN
jgi:hypothetical protein